MQRRILETRKKTFGGMSVTWRRITDAEGNRQESWELSDEDFLRLVADSVALSRLKIERFSDV
jgi:hypothetical protein